MTISNKKQVLILAYNSDKTVVQQLTLIQLSSLPDVDDKLDRQLVK